MSDQPALVGQLSDYSGKAWSRRRLLLGLGAGIGIGLGQTPFGLPIVGTFAIFLTCLLVAASRGPKAAFVAGWATGVGYFALVLHWIVEPFLVDVARHGWMAPFALVLVSAGFALFWGVAAALARFVAPGIGILLAWPAAMALAEMLRSKILTGFPWGQIGYQWVDGSVLHWAAFVGPYGLSLLTFLLASLALLVMWRKAGAAWLGVGIVPPLLMIGAAGLTAPPPHPEATGPLVRLVQPNAPQHQKWDPDFAMEFYRRQVSFTAAPGLPDLVVWPETSIPWTLESATLALAEIGEAGQGAPVVLGAQRRDGEDWYNSLLVIGSDGEVRHLYDKYHLVPFGEYIPLDFVLRRFGLSGVADVVGGFSAGSGAGVLDLGGLGTALPLICYEAIFPRHVREAPERPDYILHITNDAWFGRIAGPQQHLVQARFRAVEFGLPVVRAANTGISAMIDPQGRVIESIPLREAGFVDVRVPDALPPTHYARFGDIPVMVAGLLLLGLGALVGRRNQD